MDPNATLAEALQLSADLLADDGTDDEATAANGVRLAELVDSLDRWLRRGGALPTRWTFPRLAVTPENAR